MKHKKEIAVGLLLIFLGWMFLPAALAQNDSLVGGQSPNETLSQIFDPIERFFGWVSGFIENIMTHLFDWNWIRGIFVGVFGAIDGWIEKITGNNLADIFRIIGHALSEVFYSVVEFIKDEI